MEEKKTFGARMEKFFAGKGFYIVLLLCVAVIGVSAWSMLRAGGGAESDELTLPVSGLETEDFADVVRVTRPPAVTVTEAPATPAHALEAEEGAPEATEAPAPAETETAAIEETVPAAELLDYYIWPVTGAVETDYSMAALVYDVTMRDWRTHDGLDLAADKGDQVRAVANGRVTAVYDDERWGTTVVIQHSGGLTSTYSNLAAAPAVAVGDQVGVGQVIGAVGDTALAEIGQVSHLHFAMARDGVSVDPKEYMP